MYQQNLQTTIIKLPETTNNISPGQNVIKLTNTRKSNYKSIQRLRTYLFIAAIAAFTILSTGCEEPGNVGGRFLDDDANLETNSIAPESIEGYSSNTYTGRLRLMAIGQYDDMLFGEFKSTGIIKPAIDTTGIGTSITEEQTLKLRLVFSPVVYGDTLSTADFDLYRATEIWRGNELRFNQTIPYDETQKVGEFSVTGRETVEVELDHGWVEEYNEFLSYEEDDRNNYYRDNFPGLVIVPAESNNKVLFAKLRPASDEEDDDLDFVRFVLEDGGEENGGDNGEENGEDEETEEDPRTFQRIQDWGSLQSRAEPAGQPEGIIVHNTLDQFGVMEPGINADRLGSKNLANVQLVFYQDQSQLEGSLPEGHSRPEVSLARIHVIDTGSIGDMIFSQSPNFISQLDPDDNSYRFDLSNYANSVLFSTPITGRFYIAVESINGLVFSTLLFNENAPEELRPRILITSVKTGSE
jgi:hypothetical protein